MDLAQLKEDLSQLATLASSTLARLSDFDPKTNKDDRLFEEVAELRRAVLSKQKGEVDIDPYVGCEEARKRLKVSKSIWYGPNGLSGRIRWVRLSERRRAARLSSIKALQSELETEVMD